VTSAPAGQQDKGNRDGEAQDPAAGRSWHREAPGGATRRGSRATRHGVIGALAHNQPRGRAATAATSPACALPDRPGCSLALRSESTGGGPHDYGRSIAPGPARAAPLGLLLSQQIIGVGPDEQLHERRMHDVPPPGPAAVLVACRALHRAEDRARLLIHSASTVMPHTARVRSGKICHSGRTFARIVDGYLGLAVTSWSGRPRRVGSEHRVMSIDSVTLSDGGCQGERAQCRRSGACPRRPVRLTAARRSECSARSHPHSRQAEPTLT